MCIVLTLGNVEVFQGGIAESANCGFATRVIPNQTVFCYGIKVKWIRYKIYIKPAIIVSIFFIVFTYSSTYDNYQTKLYIWEFVHVHQSYN